MAIINGVYHPTDGDPYNLTGDEAGDGDLGQLAISVETMARDVAAAAAAEVQYAFTTALDSSTNINTLPTGVYSISSTAAADELGLPLAAPGSLTVNNASLVYNARNQLFHAHPGPGEVSRLFVRNLLSGQWSDWKELPSMAWPQGSVAADADLNEITEQGYYGMSPTPPGPNRPIYDNNGAILEVLRHGVGIIQRYTSIRPNSPTVWVRRGNNSSPPTWWDWVQVGGDTGGGGGDAAALPRRELLQQGLRARKGGTIGTGGRGVVSLRFDDAAGDFARDVLPLLEERALPFTRVTTTDRVGNTAGGEDDTWPNIQDYCIRAGGEVWNHGKTHGTADTNEQIDAEVSGALATLRANLPRLPIDCWSPPGGQTTGWGGYMPAETIEQLTESYAGQQIMAHHALSSGYLTNTWYPTLDGVLRDGQLFYSSDIRDLAFITTLIDRARDYPSGVVIMFHANNIGESGYITLSDFVAVLDYIVAQRDAGNILVLTVSGQAVADAASDHRHDLLKTHSGTDWSEYVAFPAARPGITGSTRELTATVTGTPEATVTSVVGESTKEHTIPAGGTLALRHPATIPTDATSVPVSITGGATADAHLYAI